jgi:signal transduction histidine kinase/ActR/RegA family two-component response regulator
MARNEGEAQPAEKDCSLSALEYIHRFLVEPPAEQKTLPSLLADLASAFDAPAAEMRSLNEDGCRRRVGLEGTGWAPPPSLPTQIQHSRLALADPLPGGGQALATVILPRDQPGWLLWLEDPGRLQWTPGEAGALALAAHALERWLASGNCTSLWMEQFRRQQSQQRLEIVAQAARRLAHDLGNIFTGILGFSELSLAHPAPGSGLIHTYLKEIHRSAQTGSRLTNQLRLFSRRQQGRPAHCSLQAILDEQTKRLQSNVEHSGKLCLDVPNDLPPVGFESEQLHLILEGLLDNAVEAAPRHSEVTVTGRLVDVETDQCAAYYGALQPGKHVQLWIEDRGPGMTAEQWQRVLVEPLFTTKARHRGMGLAVAYGILHAHQGGLRLRPRPEAGVEAELLLPVARAALPLPEYQATGSLKPVAGPRVLVVDDDPLILSYVRNTLEQAGYRVKAAGSAEDAFQFFLAAGAESFHLVLSDIVMPHATGLDLARQLLQRDAGVRLLFMSGQVSSDFAEHDLAKRFELLPKPFRPDALLKAVRLAMDKSSSRMAHHPGEESFKTGT